MMTWQEKYMGGSKDVEDGLIQELAEKITRLQRTVSAISTTRSQARQARLERGFHAKGTGVHARFWIADDLPRDFQTNLFRPGAEYRAVVRFSNAGSTIHPDARPDQRGIAVRVFYVDGDASGAEKVQDFLMTNTPASFAPDPVQFMAVGEFLVDAGMRPFLRLCQEFGTMSVIRMFTRLLQPLRFVQPWQTTPFWSRTPFTFNAYAVKFLLRPCDLDHGGFLGWFQTFWRARADPDYLRNKLAERLRHSDVTFDFRVQLFVDEERTPIEDASREWKESIAPFRTLAQLIIPKQNLDDPLNADIERMAFDPWHTEDHRPLGRMNRARRLVYPTSAKARLQERPVDEC